MYRKINAKNTFNRLPEAGQNPFVGFMSFQHFRGEKLYSDIEVLPENNYTETERVECYPVVGTPENGREEGYYPDTTVVYIRMLWKELEPERGVYNYDVIESLLDEARKHKQTLVFRLMAHSTRACDDVPEWLKSLIPCPLRPDGQRVKDSPTDPLFVELFLEAVSKIGERFDGDPVFDAIDISLPGAWGEGHNLHLYSDDILTRTVDAYTSVFKKTRLICQLARPDLIEYASRASAVGWRGDGFGEPTHLNTIYPEKVERLSELWRSAPVSFESYWWLGEWKRRGWDIDEIIKRSLEWHVSTFNAKSIPVPHEWRDKVDAWIAKMGYHFAISSFEYPSEAEPLDTVELRLTVENFGVAPIYNKLPLNIRVRKDGEELVFTTDADITAWLPGSHEYKTSLALAEGLSRGEYKIELGIISEYSDRIYFATDAPMSGEYYTVATINII